MSVLPPEYAAQCSRSVLGEPSERAPQRSPQEHCAAQVTSRGNHRITELSRLCWDYFLASLSLHQGPLVCLFENLIITH